MIDPITIPVPTVVGAFGAWTAVSTLKKTRTLVFKGTAGDQVEVWTSNDAGTNSSKIPSPGRLLQGAQDSFTVDNAVTHYAAKRLAGTSAASLIVGGEEFPTTDSIQWIELTVGHADLTAAATSQAILLGSALPENALILAIDIAVATAFTGGGAAAASIDIGAQGGDTDGLVDGASIFTAVSGGAATRPLGVRPNAFYTVATQLLATFISDVNVVDLTAGACTIRVAYLVKAA